MQWLESVFVTLHICHNVDSVSINRPQGDLLNVHRTHCTLHRAQRRLILHYIKVWLQIPSIKLWGDDDVVGDVDDDNEDEEEEYTMMMISSEVPLGVRSPNETVDSAALAALPPHWGSQRLTMMVMIMMIGSLFHKKLGPFLVPISKLGGPYKFSEQCILMIAKVDNDYDDHEYESNDDGVDSNAPVQPIDKDTRKDK